MQDLLSRRPSLSLGLPALILVSMLGAKPGFAATQTHTQPMSHQSEPIMVANLSNVLRDINRGAQRVQQEIQRQQREQERRNREAARQQRQQEQEAARRAAAERRRLEAERERQYFESLTPEQQQAYLAEQRARQAAQTEAMIRIMDVILRSGSGESAPASSRSDSLDDCLRLRIRSRACGTD